MAFVDIHYFYQVKKNNIMLLSTQCFIGITPNPQDSYITNDKKSDHHIKRGLQNEIEGFKKQPINCPCSESCTDPHNFTCFQPCPTFLDFL